MSFAGAQAPETFTIHRTEPQNRAVVATPKAYDVKINDEFAIETPYGDCNLVVTQVIVDYFYVDTSQCQSEFVQQGTLITSTKPVVVERAVTQVTPEPIAMGSTSTNGEGFVDSEFYKQFIKERLSAYVVYSTGKSLDGRVALDNQTAIEDFEGSNTLGLGAEYKAADLPYSLSVTGGFEYNLPRSYGSYRLTTPAGSGTANFLNSAKLQTLSLFANIRYQFHDKAYAVLGINHLFAQLSDFNGDMSGDFGFHVGARYYVLPQFFVDGNLNFYNLNYKYQSARADFSLTELAIKAGYTF